MVTADKLSAFFDEKVKSVRKLTENAAQPIVRDLTDEMFVEFNECSMADV